MSRPQIQQALAMKGMDFNEVIGGIDRIAKSDRRLLYQEMHKVFEVVKQFDPNVESEFFKSVIGRERSRSFTKKYHGNVKTVDPTKYGKNNLAAARSVRTITDFSEFRNLEGTGKLKDFFSRMKGQGMVTGSFNEFSQKLIEEGIAALDAAGNFIIFYTNVIHLLSPNCQIVGCRCTSLFCVLYIHSNSISKIRICTSHRVVCVYSASIMNYMY
jgi:hypothetical protein